MGTFSPQLQIGNLKPPTPTGSSFAPRPTQQQAAQLPADPTMSPGAQGADAAARNAASAANPRNGMTAAQNLQYTQWMSMTPQQQQDYVKGQAAGAASAGAAASRAGDLAASNVGPGGPQSAGVLADNARAEEAGKAGLDFMRPGAAEEFQSKYGLKPLEQSGYANWLDKNRMDPNATTRQQAHADSVLSQSHGVGDADFDKYYDRAEQNAAQRLNDQLSARGSYGSSVGIGQIGAMLADMEGNRAKDKAAYGLARSADDRSWVSTQGELASGADASGINRWATAADAEAGASRESLDRWKVAENAAVDAQGAQRTRGQDFFNNNMAIGGALSDTAGRSYDAGLVQDQALVDAVVSMGLAKDAESVAQIIQRANQNDAQAKQILDLAMTLKAQNQPAAAQPTGGRA